MSGNLYQWFGYISNASNQSSGVIGPLTATLNAAGNDIINVGLLSANQISVSDLTVQNCITGPAGLLTVCQDLDVTGNTNTASLSVETTSTLVGDVDVQSTMHMPNSEPLNTVKLFSVTNISSSGPPTSTPVKGSLVFTDVDKILWVYDGSVWKDVITVSVPPLSSVLLQGNTSGASNILMSSGQKILFANNLKLENSTNSSNIIGFNNVNTIPSINLILGNSNSINASSNITLGNGNTSNFNNTTLIGNLVTATSADQITLGSTLEKVNIPGYIQECKAEAFKSVANGLRAAQISANAGANNYLILSGDVGHADVIAGGAANSNLELNTKSSGTGQVIANINAASSLKSLGFVESVKQSGASVAIRSGIDPVSNFAASSTLPVPFTHVNYNFFSNTKTTYIGANKFLLEPLTAYTASFYYRATDPNTHSNNVDLRMYIQLNDGTPQIMAANTIYYPNTKRASEGSVSCTFFTSVSATQELSFILQNTSNDIVRMVEFLGNVTRIN